MRLKVTESFVPYMPHFDVIVKNKMHTKDENWSISVKLSDVNERAKRATNERLNWATWENK